MTEQHKYTACVIIIGNEILSGRTRDANLQFIGERCDELGIELQECRVIMDNEETIVSTVSLCKEKFTYVFTTGGIGPTHDDISSAAIAKAFNQALMQHPDAVAAMACYYPSGQLTKARLKMAEVPKTATLIHNPVSAAPGFQIENVFVLPGVPNIMQAMFAGITHRLVGGEPVQTRSVTTHLPESIIAAGLAALQNEYPDISIGSYPCLTAGQTGVTICLRSANLTSLTELTTRLEQMLKELRKT